MRIKNISLHSYQIPMSTGQLRDGILVQVDDDMGQVAWGDVAPLPNWSQETLRDAIVQIMDHREALGNAEWDKETCPAYLSSVGFYPSVHFGLESAILSLLDPLSEYRVSASALFMGSPDEIREQAKRRQQEGFTSAKLKVSNLSFDEAAELIRELNDDFYLRIDVNRAWETKDSLQFFSQFAVDTFDYVEEPFKDPKDLCRFTHPLAVDESFPHDLTLHDLETLPTLKALIYKPTLQGGLYGCHALKKWVDKQKISIVLSSSFESDIGLAHVASIAYRLSLHAPIGVGTYYFMNRYLGQQPVQFSKGVMHVPGNLF